MATETGKCACVISWLHNKVVILESEKKKKPLSQLNWSYIHTQSMELSMFATVGLNERQREDKMWFSLTHHREGMQEPSSVWKSQAHRFFLKRRKAHLHLSLAQKVLLDFSPPELQICIVSHHFL